MLSFAAEFRLRDGSGFTDIITVFRDWLLESPHTELVESDLVLDDPLVNSSIGRGKEKIRLLGISDSTRYLLGLRKTVYDGDIDWTSELVFSCENNESWISIRTSRESERPAFQLPPAKKPIIVSLMLGMIGGGPDGDLSVSSNCHYLTQDDIDLATRLINGDANCYLPVVYVSRGFDGYYYVDPQALASDLGGLAHIVVEPDRFFSNRLQISVDGQNTYGGVVGIYWGDGAERRHFFLPRDYSNAAKMKRAIIDSVRTAWLHRRPIPNGTWTSVEEVKAAATYLALRSSGSQEVHRYVEAFDAEIKAKDKRLEEAELEIGRLRRSARSSSSQVAPGSGLQFSSGVERDLFSGEMADAVYDVLSAYRSSLAENSRRLHIMDAIIASNKRTGISDAKRE